MLTLEEIVRQVRTLPIADQKRLIGLIVDALTDQDPHPHQSATSWNFKGLARKFGEGSMRKNMSINYAANGMTVLENI
jgi:hypothetical protein